eukprot:209529-Prymnesium_polylepis.1
MCIVKKARDLLSTFPGTAIAVLLRRRFELEASRLPARNAHFVRAHAKLMRRPMLQQLGVGIDDIQDGDAVAAVLAKFSSCRHSRPSG